MNSQKENPTIKSNNQTNKSIEYNPKYNSTKSDFDKELIELYTNHEEGC